MANLLIVSTAVTIFLFITFIGIFIYLMKVYRRWSEPSIGFWGLGSFLIAMSLIFQLLNNFFINTFDDKLIIVYSKIALIYFFLGIWAFTVAHPIARRTAVDLLGFGATSVILGIILNSIWNQEIIVFSEEKFYKITTDETIGLNFKGALITFSIIVYVIIVRDSYLLYQASKTNVNTNYRKSIAYTHFISWQFWAIGIFIISLTPLVDQLKFVFVILLLLVPIITLGSRPFDWAREGYEPILLLLIDEYGTAVFSWTATIESPLILEGGTVASIRNLLENLAHEKVENMTINFSNSSLYAWTTNGYLSILLTTGKHNSFEDLLHKIHQTLITSIVTPIEFGIPQTDFPEDLKWLLHQLLPLEVDSYITQSQPSIDIFQPN